MFTEKPYPDFDENDLLSALSELLSQDTLQDGKGMTFREIQSITGHSKQALRRLLMRLHEEGRLRSDRVRRIAIDGTLRTVPAYWVVPPLAPGDE